MTSALEKTKGVEARSESPESTGDVNAPRRPGRSILPKVRVVFGRAAPAIVLFVVLLGAWEWLVRAIDVPVLYVPAPSAIWGEVTGRLGFYMGHAIVTLKEAGLGLLLGAGIAGVAAVFMAEFRLVDRALLPLFVVIKVTPGVTLVPLFVIWLGFGMGPKVILATMTVFYAVLINAITGFKSVDEGALEVLQSVSASRLEIFFRLRLPNSLPHLFSAAKIGLPLAVLGAVFAEMYNSKEGLGNVILQAGHNINMVTLWGGIAVLAVLGVFFVTLVGIVEHRLLHWHASTKQLS